MGGIALGARLLVAIVFGVAAVSKARDLAGTRRALDGFRVPEWAIPSAALLLPLAEFATAVALLLQPSARWGAVSAVCLLGLFIAAIARALARGDTPDCNCFGRLASGQADQRALIRNVLLAVPAAFVVAYGPGDRINLPVAGYIAIAAGVCAAALAAVVARLWPQNRRLRRDLEFLWEVQESLPPGLPIGAKAPNFSFPGVDGSRISLEALLRHGLPVALVSGGPACVNCDHIFPDLARWQSTLAERITIAVLSRGSVREAREIAKTHGLKNVLALDSSNVPSAFGMKATPAVVIVAPNGRIASRPFVTPAMTEAAIRNVLHSDYSLPALSISDEHSPALSLVTVNGDP